MANRIPATPPASQASARTPEVAPDCTPLSTAPTAPSPSSQAAPLAPATVGPAVSAVGPVGPVGPAINVSCFFDQAINTVSIAGPAITAAGPAGLAINAAGFVHPAINSAGPVGPKHSQTNTRTPEVDPDGTLPRTALPGFIVQSSSPKAPLAPPTFGPVVSIAGPVGSAISYQHRQTCWLDVFPQLRLIHNSAIRILIILLECIKQT